MKELFDSYIETAFGEHKQAEFKFAQFEKNYKRFFPPNKNAFVLDIGIGRGEMLSCMKNWGYQNYLGVDISPSTVNYCKSLGLNCLMVGDVTKWLTKRNDSFELITLLDVLEHIKKEETIEFLKALKLSLKEGGILIIQVPNLQAPDGQLHRYNDFTHEVGYVEHSLQQVLKTAGFNEISFYGFEDSISRSWKEIIRIILRAFFWKYTRFIRIINGNLNPEILNPVFYAVVKK